jgi:uncharacterized membrane protein YccF (DUF307 family)
VIQGNSGGGNVVVVAESAEPNLLIRALWFFFVGWWLSGIATLIAILLQLTILGIPLAVWVVNRMPQIVTLKSSRKLSVTTDEAGVTMVMYADREQRPFLHRAIYYVLVGWWAASIWLSLAWLAAVTIIGLPLAFWMYGATGKVQTLRR